MALGGLGRRKPTSFEHVRRMPMTAMLRVVADIKVEKSLILPSWHTKHDQGKEGACVGFGTSMMLSILNEQQVRKQGQLHPYIRFNPWWLWNQAKLIDPWEETNPGDSSGTTVKAACQILVEKGHVIWEPEDSPYDVNAVPEQSYGVEAVRWAVTVNEMRSAIGHGIPMAIGVNWYSAFNKPELDNDEYWIAKSGDLGVVEGGHCVCVYGASDERQAFRMKNSWGTTYPEVWVPYKVTDRLIREDGEVVLVTDR